MVGSYGIAGFHLCLLVRIRREFNLGFSLTRNTWITLLGLLTLTISVNLPTKGILLVAVVRLESVAIKGLWTYWGSDSGDTPTVPAISLKVVGVLTPACAIALTLFPPSFARPRAVFAVTFATTGITLVPTLTTTGTVAMPTFVTSGATATVARSPTLTATNPVCVATFAKALAVSIFLASATRVALAWRKSRYGAAPPGSSPLGS